MRIQFYLAISHQSMPITWRLAILYLLALRPLPRLMSAQPYALVVVHATIGLAAL